MSLQFEEKASEYRSIQVTILVLVEMSLQSHLKLMYCAIDIVTILVLVEMSHRGIMGSKVTILVLVEMSLQSKYILWIFNL